MPFSFETMARFAVKLLMWGSAVVVLPVALLPPINGASDSSHQSPAVIHAGLPLPSCCMLAITPIILLEAAAVVVLFPVEDDAVALLVVVVLLFIVALSLPMLANAAPPARPANDIVMMAERSVVVDRFFPGFIRSF